MIFERILPKRAPRTALIVAALLSSATSGWAQGALNACDLNADGAVNVIDVQLAINMDLALLACTATVDGVGICSNDVVNKVVTAALGGSCVTSHNVVLNWSASTSSNIAGYNIYRSNTTGGPYTKLNAATVVPTTYTDLTVVSGQTYYYVATTVDTSGNESVKSNQALAAVPTP